MRRLGWRIVPIFLFLLLSLFLWKGLSLDPHKLPSVQVGRPVPVFKIADLEKPDAFFESTHLPHKVILLNVWASWCEACVEEQVFLLQLARKGVPLYGLNYKDNPALALNWLKQWGNPYQQIGQDEDGRVAIDLGVYGAPETFIIDKKGLIRYRHAGILTQAVWENEISPLMQELEHTS